MISADQALSAQDIQKLVDLTGAATMKRLVTSQENILRISQLVQEHGPIRLDELVAKSGLSAAVAEGAVLWLAKYDKLRISV